MPSVDVMANLPPFVFGGFEELPAFVADELGELPALVADQAEEFFALVLEMQQAVLGAVEEIVPDAAVWMDAFPPALPWLQPGAGKVG